MNASTLQFLSEDYPFGIPSRLISVARDTQASSELGTAGASSNVVFSGASASKLAIVFFEDLDSHGAARALLVKAITDGLQRGVQEVLLVQCSVATQLVSLKDCAPRVVLVAGAPEKFLVDLGAPESIESKGNAKIIHTEAMTAVLTDLGAKKRFWQALKQAWEESRR